MQERWGSALLDDPMQNPNLALDASYPSRPAFPPRVASPWRRGARSGEGEPRGLVERVEPPGVRVAPHGQ